MLGRLLDAVHIGDLPIIQADIRALTLYTRMRAAMRRYSLPRARPGSGIELAYRIVRAHTGKLLLIAVLSVLSAGVWYLPAYFLRQIVHYLEVDPSRDSVEWGVLFVVGLLSSYLFVHFREPTNISAFLSNISLTNSTRI